MFIPVFFRAFATMSKVAFSDDQPQQFSDETSDLITCSLASKGWAIVDDWVSADWIDELRKELRVQDGLGLFRMAGVGRESGFQQNASIRSDRIQWLDPALCWPAQRRYLELLEQLRLAVNRELYLGLYNLELHAAIYSPGSFYQRHLDTFQSCDRRALTTILYLNPCWEPEEGGALRIYLDAENDSEYMDILPQAGRLVTFLSNRFPHEVLPTRRERASLTGWFSRRDG